jgi:glyoxylase-like metal-dependent hydrolase (beta-lactamase superfamily II)
MTPSLLLALLLGQPVSASTPTAPAPSPGLPIRVAEGIHLIRGAVEPGRGPDGNTIVIDAPDGLIVVDTGRHAYHSDAILAFARERKRPIAAIVNTHWHLDHSSGNGRLKAVFPKARVYTTSAVDRAIAPDGFLGRDLANVRELVAKPGLPAVQKDEIEIFLKTMDERGHLRPDVPVERSGPLTLAGRSFDARVTDGAVSDADLWLYDPSTRLAIIGDLVTVPVPYFETACPDRWKAAMDNVWATPFTTAIPGHGAPMTREQFDTYRSALGAFIDCARSEAPAASCSAGWLERAGTLIEGPAERRSRLTNSLDYYVGYLRKNGGKSPDCRAR